MKKILIATLGNRDLQLSSESNFPAKFYDVFEKGGSDTGANLIIKKTGGGFLKNSKTIFGHYEELADKVSFPMVETYLEKLGEKPDLIVLISTKQEPLDSQDCHYVVLFLQRWLENRGYKVDYYPLECSPVDFPELVNVFSMFYDGYRDGQMFVGNSGGTPDMRAASYAAGFFKNIQFITIHARTKQVNISNYLAQEKLVLKHVIENILTNFDYSALFQLPINDPQLKLYAEYAIARLALDFGRSNELAKRIGDSDLIMGENLGIREKEIEVWISGKIKFKQRAWGDYLWRLFLIQENLWIPLLEEKMGGKIIFNKSSKFQEWKNLLGQNPDLQNFLANKKIGKESLKYEMPTKKVYECIIEFYDRGNALRSDPKLRQFFVLESILDKSMRDLRNGVAHNYKGINQDIIEEELQEKSQVSINLLHKHLSEYTGIPVDSFGIYDIINARILAFL